MRRFSSYGPVDTDLHFYAPRTHLVDSVLSALVGENPEQGGDYVTVWAPGRAASRGSSAKWCGGCAAPRSTAGSTS